MSCGCVPEMISDMRVRAMAGVVLNDGAGRVLLMRRRDDDTWAWGIPGGALEPGDSWVDAALRECHRPIFGPDAPVLRDAVADTTPRPVLG